MEDAVDDDTMELLVVGLAKLLGIGAHGVETDDKVAVDAVALVVVEGDDVGVVVVTKIFAVDLEYLLVVNKHISDFSHLPAIFRSHGLYPSRGFALFYIRHFHALTVVCYHILYFFICKVTPFFLIHKEKSLIFSKLSLLFEHRDTKTRSFFILCIFR